MIGFENAGVTAGALYYLVSSTLGLAGLFLVVELMERGRSPGDDVLAVTLEAYGDDEETEHAEETGVATPATFAALGVAFIFMAILVAGMPPLSGFLGKFAMIGAMLDLPGGEGHGSLSVWVTIAVLIVAGLAATIALMRIGMNTFWVSLEGVIPAVRGVEIAPILLFLSLGILMTVYAQPVMSFMEVVATGLYTRGDYVEAVLGVAGGRQ
jgi:multicomponent K+:H+ antiporter subunit D